MGRRVLNRKDLRADFEAAERRKDVDETEEKEEDEEEEGDEDEDEESEDEEGGEDDDDDDDGEDGEGDDDEDKPKKKKKKKVVKVAKPKAKARTRTPKVIRMRVVWGVFANNNQCVATYDYPKRKDAEQHAARLMSEKRSTFFVQPVKEQIEEKKEK